MVNLWAITQPVSWQGNVGLALRHRFVYIWDTQQKLHISKNIVYKIKWLKLNSGQNKAFTVIQKSTT